MQDLYKEITSVKVLFQSVNQYNQAILIWTTVFDLVMVLAAFLFKQTRWGRLITLAVGPVLAIVALIIVASINSAQSQDTNNQLARSMVDINTTGIVVWLVYLVVVGAVMAWAFLRELKPTKATTASTNNKKDID